MKKFSKKALLMLLIFPVVQARGSSNFLGSYEIPAFILNSEKLYKKWNEFDEKKPSILIEMATRSRPKQLLECLNLYYKKLSGNFRYHILVVFDEDDNFMNNATILDILSKYPNLTFKIIKNKASSKVGAVNEGFEEFFNQNKNERFDILVVVASDDMWPVVDGYDEIIAKTMLEKFPDFDGVLNFSDGNQPELNTFPIVGKNYYNQFYIYHKEYVSFFADTELTSMSRILRKEFISPIVLVKHRHAGNLKAEMDELYKKNDKFFSSDQKIYKKHRKKNFDLDENKIFPIQWSILLYTGKGIQDNSLRKELERQIKKSNFQDEIEILSGKDKNLLIQKSHGKYISFINNNDWIHENYVKTIYKKFEKNPDYISLSGITPEDSKNYARPIHSIEHLNPIKNIIASQFLLSKKNKNAAKEWWQEIVNSELLQKKESINGIFYFYNYRKTDQNLMAIVNEEFENFERIKLDIGLMFSLANIYDQTNNLKESLFFYNLSIGLLKLELAKIEKNWKKALVLYLESYEESRGLIEPIIKISEHFSDSYDLDSHGFLSYIFACSIPDFDSSEYKIKHFEKHLYDFDRNKLMVLAALRCGKCTEGIDILDNLLENYPENPEIRAISEKFNSCNSVPRNNRANGAKDLKGFVGNIDKKFSQEDLLESFEANPYSRRKIVEISDYYKLNGKPVLSSLFYKMLDYVESE